VQLEHLSAHADFLQQLDQSLGQTFGEFDQAVPIGHMNATDLTGLESGFIGDGPHQIAGLHAVFRTHFDAKGLERPCRARPAGRLGSGRLVESARRVGASRRLE
jgi:hypothetical protein